MLSVNGILALGGIFTGCYLLFLSVKQLRKNISAADRRKSLLAVFFLSYVAVMMLVFFVTRGSEPLYHYPLYLSLCFSWAVPVLLTALEDIPAAIHPLQPKKIFAVVTVIFVLLSSFVNICYFNGSDRFPQTYEGLGFQNRDKKAELEDVAAYLSAEGYDKGYACHWEGNILTEMTDGQIPMVAIFCGENGNLSYAPYLYSLWLRESPCEKPFLLLTEEGSSSFMKSDSSAFCTQIYSDYHHVVYSIDNLEDFVETLNY